MRPLMPPPVLGVFVGVIMWFVNRRFEAVGVVLPGQFLIAVFLFATGVLIDLISVGFFIKARTTLNPIKLVTTRQLVTSGLYNFSRNPMYLGQFLILCGWAIWLGNILNLGLLAVFGFYLTYFQIKPEERALAQKFGAEYADYKSRVRRWL